MWSDGEVALLDAVDGAKLPVEKHQDMFLRVDPYPASGWASRGVFVLEFRAGSVYGFAQGMSRVRFGSSSQAGWIHCPAPRHPRLVLFRVS